MNLSTKVRTYRRPSKFESVEKALTRLRDRPTFNTRDAYAKHIKLATKKTRLPPSDFGTFLRTQQTELGIEPVGEVYVPSAYYHGKVRVWRWRPGIV